MKYVSYIIILVIIVVSFTLLRNRDLPSLDVYLEVNGETVKAMPGSYCRDELLSSVCVDMIPPDKYDFSNSTVTIDGDVLAIVDAPRDFLEEEVLIKDLNGGIFEFMLHSKKGDVVFYIYVK